MPGSTQGAEQTGAGVTSQNAIVANDEPLNVSTGATPTVLVDDPSKDVEAATGAETQNADNYAATQEVFAGGATPAGPTGE